MTFLPIVDRELRVAARQRGTYRIRLAVALIAVLGGTVVFLANFGSPPAQTGQNIFLCLAGVCVCYCVVAGRISTADCLSEEKREGTLGLLFLTDLKGYDIVLGKLASTSMGGLYSLLAVLPVLALPLLLGGVSSSEFWRMVLVLVNTFLLSLAIGMFSSAISRDAHRAAAANFALSVFFLVVLPLVLFGLVYSFYQLFMFGGTPPTSALASSPLYSFYLSSDTSYALHTDGFWCSSLIVAGQTFLFLAAACRIVPRTWQDKPFTPPRARKISWSGFWRGVSYGSYGKLAPFRKELLDRNAFYWLAARARLKPLHVWVFLALAALWWLFNWATAGGLQHDEAEALCFTLAGILNCTLKAWIALESGRELAEGQKVGALELLLSTPLTVGDILRGQFLALRRQFLKPLLVAVAVELIFTPLVLWRLNNSGFELRLWLAVIVLLVADALTLPVVAMRLALTAKSPTQAVLQTVSRVLFLPWVIFALTAGTWTLWNELFSPYLTGALYPSPSICLALWFWGGIIVDLFFGLRAWRQLNTHFRELATNRFAPPPPHAMRRIRSLTRLSHRKKLILAGATLAGAAACGYYEWQKSKPDYPPPLEVSITQSNAPLRVFPGWTTTYFIWPDGSLWCWGAAGSSGAAETVIPTPERVETNDDWIQVSSLGPRSVGLRKDGTLWELNANHPSALPPVSAHDWARVSAGGRHTVAVKKDGSLWGWGDNYFNQLGGSTATPSLSPVQIGSEAGWADVLAQYNCTLALRTNGTLWVWGQPWSQQTGRVSYPTPTLMCDGSNWIGLSAGYGMWPWAWNASGEAWQLTPALADPTISVSAIGQLIVTNSAMDRLVEAYVGQPKLFEVRLDGSLWGKNFSAPPNFIVSPDEKWSQVGSRSDWRKLWSSGGTVFGLTADGTLWTWGLDPSRGRNWTFSRKVQFVEEILKGRAGAVIRASANAGAPAWLIQETPRPLLHLNYGH